MKNQYCKICGTLLPEDGVCLRCGAVYHFADDGTPIEPVRKVKKVSVKPAKKKGIIVKKAIDPSEAETKTIPIPEDVYSFSDESNKTDKSTDWTAAKKEDVSFNKAPKYVPNFVLLDEEPYHNKEQEWNTYSEPSVATSTYKEPSDKSVNDSPAKTVAGNGISPGVLVGIFLLSALIAGIVAYLLIGNFFGQRAPNRIETTAQSEMITKETAPGKSGTDIQPAFTAKTLTYTTSYDYDNGGSASYSLESSTGKLTIDVSGDVDEIPVFLPLIEGDSFAGKHLSVSSFDEEMYGVPDELLCESELITRGVVKEIQIIKSEMGYEYSETYQFDVDAGMLMHAYVVEHTEYYDKEHEYDEYDTMITQIDYSYESGRQLKTIIRKTDTERGTRTAGSKTEIEYSKDGFITEIDISDDALDGEEARKKKLFYTDGKLTKVSTGDLAATVSYDNEGRISEIKNASNWDDSISYIHFNYSNSNTINSFVIGHSEGSKNFTYNHVK